MGEVGWLGSPQNRGECGHEEDNVALPETLRWGAHIKIFWLSKNTFLDYFNFQEYNFDDKSKIEFIF